MTETPTPAKPGLLDRLFVYGIRAILVVVAIIAGGVALIVHGWLVDRLDYIASGAIIIVIGAIIGVAVIRTEYTMITKKYFEPQTMVGKVGRAHSPMRHNGKGVVLIENETWSAIGDQDIAKGDWVIVTAIESDRVTLRVKRHQP